MPRVSIIMNCYNGERYLKEAIDSVFAQSYPDWEIVFWDNASTDRTAAIAQGYGSRLRYYCSEKTVPLGHARKLAMEKVTGDWIGFLDCDDYWLPHKLAHQMQAVEGTDYTLCYGGIREIDVEGRELRKVLPLFPSGMLFEPLLNQFDINMVTPLLRRSVLEKYDLDFDPNVTASEEYNLFMRMAPKGPFCTIPEVLGVWRISTTSLTTRQISQWAVERFYTLDQIIHENPGIAEKYPAAFRKARARGSYYRARYLVSQGDIGGARQEMRTIAGQDKRYLALWMSLFLPGLWTLLHNEKVRRKYLGRLGGSARYA
jgi:glycosyltransferase involved in cell wall biosynthesis